MRLEGKRLSGDSPVRALGLFLFALGRPFSDSRNRNQRLLAPSNRRCSFATCSEGDPESFSSLFGKRLPPWLVDRAAALGYTEPTPVQQEALDTILDGRDCIVQAKTGSGKTLVYILPLLAALSARSSLQALVVLPTRELAKQVTLVARKLAAGSPQRLTVMALLDGSGAKRQRKWMRALPPQVVVGNVAQIDSLLQDNAMNLGGLRLLVVDEVDACLAERKTCALLKTMLSGSLSARNPTILEPRQTLFVSATIPQRSHFQKQCMQEHWCSESPLLIHAEPTERVPSQVRHTWAPCSKSKRFAALKYFLRRHEPTLKAAIVFVRSDMPIEKISENLAGVIDEAPPTVLSEEQHLRRRADALKKLNDGSIRLILSTPLGARGLDIPHCSHIYMLSLPEDADAYIHAAGRCGRMERSGLVTVLCGKKEEFALKRLANAVGVTFEDALSDDRNADDTRE